MRALTVCYLVLLAGCGTKDPCEGQSGSCIAVTVVSSSVSMVDTIDVHAFGAQRTTMSGEASLPVQFAVVPPTGTAPGSYEITLVAFHRGAPAGTGAAIAMVGAGRSAVTISLAVESAGDLSMPAPTDGGMDAGGGACMNPTPDRCGQSCTNLQRDPQNCKTCGTVCMYAHAGATCQAGVCMIDKCESGYADCSGGPADGCETYLPTDEANCGACGKKCLIGQICNNGACADNLVNCQTKGITCIKDGCSSGKFAVSKGGGIAVDTVNGRILWTRASRGPATVSKAKQDCLGLALEGITGWRLPSLYTDVPQYMTGGLQGCPVCNPAIDQAAFNDTKTNTPAYWTAQYDANKAGYATVTYCDGRNNYWDGGTSLLLFRCMHDPIP